MKICIIKNGVLSMSITAEDEMELLALKEFAKGEITFQLHEKLQVLDKVLPNTAILTGKVKEVNQ